MYNNGTQRGCGELAPLDGEEEQKEGQGVKPVRPDDLHAWIVALDERVTTVEVALIPLLQQVRRGLLQVVRAIEKLDLL